MTTDRMEIREALDRVAKLIWMFDNEAEEWTMLARDGDALELVWSVANDVAGDPRLMLDRSHSEIEAPEPDADR